MLRGSLCPLMQRSLLRLKSCQGLKNKSSAGSYRFESIAVIRASVRESRAFSVSPLQRAVLSENTSNQTSSQGIRQQKIDNQGGSSNSTTQVSRSHIMLLSCIADQDLPLNIIECSHRSTQRRIIWQQIAGCFKFLHSSITCLLFVTGLEIALSLADHFPPCILISTRSYKPEGIVSCLLLWDLQSFGTHAKASSGLLMQDSNEFLLGDDLSSLGLHPVVSNAFCNACITRPSAIQASVWKHLRAVRSMGRTLSSLV